MFKGAKDERQSQDLRLSCRATRSPAARARPGHQTRASAASRSARFNFNNNISSRGDYRPPQADGSFQIDGLQPGAYTIAGRGRVLPPDQAQPRAGRRHERVLIELSPRAAVLGSRDVDANGKPVTSFQVLRAAL
jgi:hypothetical protein